jgi:hypothetical protein
MSKIERKIECPKCKKLEFYYAELDNGKKCIISPCGWVLVDLSEAADDMDEEYDGEEYGN